MMAGEPNNSVRLFMISFYLLTVINYGTCDHDLKNDVGIHLITLIDQETEARDLDNQLLHSACRLNYTDVKILSDWCHSGTCTRTSDFQRLQNHLKGLNPDDWAVIINSSNEYVYLMASPERAIQKLSESRKTIIVSIQPENEDKMPQKIENIEDENTEEIKEGIEKDLQNKYNDKIEEILEDKSTILEDKTLEKNTRYEKTQKTNKENNDEIDEKNNIDNENIKKDSQDKSSINDGMNKEDSENKYKIDTEDGGEDILEEERDNEIRGNGPETLTGRSKTSQGRVEEEAVPKTTDMLLQALEGGTVLGMVGTILQILEDEDSSHEVAVDDSAQHVLFGNRQKGGLSIQVPIETRFIPEGKDEREATSPFVIYSMEEMLDFYNTIHYGGDGPEYCSFTKDQEIPHESTQPRILLSLDVSKSWVPFLEEVLQGILKQNYPKDRMDVWIHAKSGIQEDELNQMKASGSNYLSLEIVKDESVDFTSLRSKCEELSCDYVLVMEPRVLLEDEETISELIKANRPIVGPLLAEMKAKDPKSNFIYSKEGEETQWHQLIQKRSIKGVFRVKEVKHLVLFRKDAIQNINIKEYKPQHYITNTYQRGYLLDPRGHKEGKKHSDLWGMRFNRFMWIRRYIHSDVLKVAKGQHKPLELSPQLYYMPFYTDRFCNDIIEEMENHGKWFDKAVDDRDEAAHQYSSRNINFEEIGYAQDYHIVLNSVHKELIASLYGNYRAQAEASLIFVLKYASGAEYGTFNYHLDGASYTLNIALNSGFTGGGLQYKLGNHHFGEEKEFVVPHNKTGWAVIQPNRPLHSHRGVALETGTRYAMINIIETNDQNCKGGPTWIE